MIDSGDTGFMIICTALVLLMTPGLAFFYGGMVRRKNVVNTMMTSIFVIGIAMVMWILFGYSLAFGNDHLGIIGDLSFLGLSNVGTTPGNYASTIPDLGFAAFQMMFAIITAPLMIGAFANRLTVSGWIKILIIWMILIYFPVAHWVWGGGFLSKLGFVDFAGGAVIHITSGFGCLGGIYVLGERKVKNEKGPFNLGLVAIGVALLLFGWYGFNAGGTVAAADIAAIVFTNTGVASATGMIVWLILHALISKRASFLESIIGAVAGLATITPASGYVTPLSAIIIGALGAIVCFFSVEFERKMWDDALDVWGVHGVGGLLGTLLIGVFADPRVNGISAGLHQFLIQLLGAGIIVVYSVLVTFIIFKVLDMIKTIKVSEEVQLKGLDQEFFKENYEAKNE